MGLQISKPDGEVWRSAMIDPPIFPVSTPQAFYELLIASASKDPNAMTTFAGAHPEIAAFGAWAKSGPWTGSYAEDRFNSLNSFVFVDSSGAEKTVRWSLLPAAQPVPISQEDLAKRGPDFLEQEITQRVRNRPVILPISGRRSRSIIAGTHCMGAASGASMSSGAPAATSFTSR